MPLVQMAGLTPASHSDLAVFKPVVDHLAGQAVLADKAYADRPFNDRFKATPYGHKSGLGGPHLRLPTRPEVA